MAGNSYRFVSWRWRHGHLARKSFSAICHYNIELEARDVKQILVLWWIRTGWDIPRVKHTLGYWDKKICWYPYKLNLPWRCWIQIGGTNYRSAVLIHTFEVRCLFELYYNSRSAWRAPGPTVQWEQTQQCSRESRQLVSKKGDLWL